MDRNKSAVTGEGNAPRILSAEAISALAALDSVLVLDKSSQKHAYEDEPESETEQDRDDLRDDGRSDGYGESYAERNL